MQIPFELFDYPNQLKNILFFPDEESTHFNDEFTVRNFLLLNSCSTAELKLKIYLLL